MNVKKLFNHIYKIYGLVGFVHTNKNFHEKLWCETGNTKKATECAHKGIHSKDLVRKNNIMNNEF